MKIKKRQYKKPRKTNHHVIKEKQSQYLFPDFHSNRETATGLMNGKKQGDIIDLGERGIYANNNKLNDFMSIY